MGKEAGHKVRTDRACQEQPGVSKSSVVNYVVILGIYCNVEILNLCNTSTCRYDDFPTPLLR